MSDIPKHQVLYFFLAVAMVLGLVSAVIPDSGLNLGFAKIKFIQSAELYKAKKIVKKDISDILAGIDTNQTENPEKRSARIVDSTLAKTKIVKKVSTIKTAMVLPKTNRLTMASFFESLKSLSGSGEKVRILHYGDSQIEGDRMTAFIRQKLQERFGGSGPGLIPATNIYPTNSFVQKFSPNFVRYTCFGGQKLTNKQYGLMNSVSRFTSEKVDTTNEVQEAWVEISPGNAAYSNAKKYSVIKMFYNGCKENCSLQVFQNDVLLKEENLIADNAYHSYVLSLSNPGKVRFVFKAKVSPNIMGISLEGESGLQVDNIAMRGSSGTFFGSIDKSIFAKQMADLNVQMIIMQFGGNSMPYLKDEAKADNFAKYIAGNLRTLQKLNPQASIVFIGPSDMSTLIDGIYQTYPMLPYVVKKLKEVTANCGVPYFDMYEAMGGLNSMPAWVENGLAGKDYIHFTPKGASLASQMFYNALFNPVATPEEN